MSGPKVWFDCLLHRSARREGDRALAALTPDDRRHLPELLGYLGSASKDVLYLAARTISRLGVGAIEALPALIGALSDDYLTARAWAVTALERLGPDARPAVPGLLGLLADPALGLRQGVIRALCQIDLTAPAVVAALLATLANDPAYEVRLSVARALADVPTPESVAALVGALADTYYPVRRAAVVSLKTLGYAARQAAPALRELLARETDEWTRMEARAALRLLESS